MRKISDITELAFNITQMSGALSLLLVEDIYHDDIIEQIELFDSDIKYEVIEYGQKPMYQKIFNYSAYSINDDSSKLMIFTKDKEPLKIDDWEISFSIDFKQRDNLPNEFELHKYSYVMKNSKHYFRFEGTDEGEEACHPYYHLHIKEDGHPRIATHIFTPYDFLIFIADMSQKCERLK